MDIGWWQDGTISQGNLHLISPTTFQNALILLHPMSAFMDSLKLHRAYRFLLHSMLGYLISQPNVLRGL
ncbi:hypothetical protein VNO77_00801 [Canavalia gladiata]|uniref:Uncharacterized protein n=1 Tax=Canavalia gladiata TaxID=3824 RepID=A0AAN9MQQ8_CANGL